ncbi:transcriptional regulator [Zavarzinia aquatilis]|uniref:Transcriptional regulator n=2 Tax=Zavarzinia aquatilis TaxID=2211142 RepID=A0A317DZA5_9PROT|nr:transcriptional regulator [Zavarzinia aquatilis]
MQAASTADLQVGRRLRQARRVKGLRLKQLADAVGCSESLLSKIENDKARPSLQMLHNIVGHLGITIGGLFTDRDPCEGIVKRPGERAIIRMDSDGVRLECLIPESGSKTIYGSIHIVEPGSGSAGQISHEGEEVGYVLEGEFELTVNDQIYRLQRGDSFFFESHLPHGYRNPGTVTTKVLWINSPPTF